VFDWGTGKVALTTKNGQQVKGLYGKMKKQSSGEWKLETKTKKLLTIDQYVKAIITKVQDIKKVVVRFTGAFRTNDSYKQIMADFEKILRENDMPDKKLYMDTLPAHLEGTYASEHSLEIAAPYFNDCQNLLVFELGGGSGQGACFRRVAQLKVGDDLEIEVQDDLAISPGSVTSNEKAKNNVSTPADGLENQNEVVTLCLSGAGFGVTTSF
jgi:hypothetical protein